MPRPDDSLGVPFRRGQHADCDDDEHGLLRNIRADAAILRRTQIRRMEKFPDGLQRLKMLPQLLRLRMPAAKEGFVVAAEAQQRGLLLIKEDHPVRVKMDQLVCRRL